jgi:hypothetical protein
MFQNLRIAIVAAALGIMVSVGVMKSVAQDNNRGTTGSGTTTTSDRTANDNGFDFGWIGLAGLAGLAGLMPRNRRDEGGAARRT